MNDPSKDRAKPGEREPARHQVSRRAAMGALGVAVGAAAGPALGQEIIASPTPAPRPPPRAELVNVFQFQEQARKALGDLKLAPILDNGDRTITDRITLRPRVNIPTRDMDLTCSLLGDDHFTPIIVGPIADQTRFHPEGEVATARGAAAARAGMVVSGGSSRLTAVAQALTTPMWVQIDPSDARFSERLASASASKAKAVVVTLNLGSEGRQARRTDWSPVDRLAKASSMPVIVKGITSPVDAKEAVARGARGVVVSNYRGGDAADLPGTLLLIDPVVQAVGGAVPVLADGSFRYGSDILKALAFGARAVLVARPVMWGLAAYGDGGVQSVIELLQTDLARFMGMCGRPSLASIDASLVRVHAPRPNRRPSVG